LSVPLSVPWNHSPLFHETTKPGKFSLIIPTIGGPYERIKEVNHNGRSPHCRQPERDDRRSARSGSDAGLPAARKTGPPEPRADRRTRGPCQRLGRTRHLHRHPRHHQVHQGQDFLQNRQGDRDDRPILDGGGRSGCGRRRARRARLRPEVLH